MLMQIDESYNEKYITFVKKYIILLEDVKLMNKESIISKCLATATLENVRKWFSDGFVGHRNVTWY